MTGLSYLTLPHKSKNGKVRSDLNHRWWICNDEFTKSLNKNNNTRSQIHRYKSTGHGRARYEATVDRGVRPVKFLRENLRIPFF